MATKAEVAQTYDFLDEGFRANIGTPHPDITCAFYNGNYSLTLDQAQAAKHDWILQGINFKPGMRVIDIGSGWGPMLKTIQDRGGEAVGLTVSPRQVRYCQERGLDTRLLDWREVQPGQLGAFDGVISVGAFEAFASKDDYLTGRQNEVYWRFFGLCNDFLPEGGRMFLQTMAFGKNMPPLEAISISAPKDSTEYLQAVVERVYPGEWLPYGQEQIVECADAQGLSLIAGNSGRLDYIQTMTEWGRLDKQFRWRKVLPWIKGFLVYTTNPYFRDEVNGLRDGANKELFKREAWDHWRLFFEKVAPLSPVITNN